MTPLDAQIVCPACRRFWHGPPGWLPYPASAGTRCSDTRHAGVSPEPVVSAQVEWLEVTLSAEDWEFAGRVGMGRQKRREGAGHRNAHGSVAGAEDHILGARGECAYSRLSGLEWTGALADIGADNDVSGVQVRTRRQHSYDLYLWPNDKRDAWWVLMTGTGPTFVFQGRIWGENACSAEFFQPAHPSGFPRAPCYVIPAHKLEKKLAMGKE